METILQNIEFQLKNVVANAPFPIGVYTGRDMKIVLANTALIKTFGKGPDIIGRSYFDVLPELEGQGIYEMLWHVLDTGEAYEVKNSRVNLVIDGRPTVYYFNYAFTPLRDSNGVVYGVMNTGDDVTELNIARQQMLEAEEKLRLAIQSAELGTYEIDLVNDQVNISGNFRNIWDMQEEVISKEMIIKRLHPDDLYIREAAHRDVGPDGRVCYEVRIHHRDSSIRWLRINGANIKSHAGTPVLVGIVQDITAHKESEWRLTQKVEQRTAELKRSNDDLLQFSHIISHDLKEPVRKIKMFSNMLNVSGKTEERKAYIERIDKASDRMMALIDGLLTYSGTNASGFPVENTDLNAIMVVIKKDLELLIDEKKAIFIEEQLPPVQGSPILLQRLFYNLVNNALKFSKADEPPRVIISSTPVSRDGKNFIRIVIEDNGIGIDPKYSDKIFNAFERLHSKDAYEGSGLGLSLCRKIVERHNGIILAVGKQDGSEFAVELPLRQEQEFI